MAFLHRLDRFLARRIEKADEAQQHEILRQVGRSETAGLHAGIGQPRERQHALALRGEPFAPSRNTARSSGAAPDAFCWRSQWSRITSGAPLTSSISRAVGGPCAGSP